MARTIEVAFLRDDTAGDSCHDTRALRLAAELVGAMTGAHPMATLRDQKQAVAESAVALFGKAGTFADPTPIAAVERLVALGIAASFEDLGGNRFAVTLTGKVPS